MNAKLARELMVVSKAVGGDANNVVRLGGQWRTMEDNGGAHARDVR